jgi:CheY-like chemotaxis protein
MRISKVVVLESDLFRRDLMTDLIVSNDHVCVAIEDADAFAEVAWGDSAEAVVVVDLDREDGQGVQALRALRELPQESQPRIVGVARRSTRTSIADDAGLRCEEFVELPLDIGEFVRAVARQSLEASIAAD